jgi:hypothetical protein
MSATPKVLSRAIHFNRAAFWRPKYLSTQSQRGYNGFGRGCAAAVHCPNMLLLVGAQEAIVAQIP